MSKSYNIFRHVLVAASTLLLCQPGLAQEPATVPDTDGVNLVAEVRIIKLSVTLDKDGKLQCEALDRLPSSTDVRNVEVQCPSRTDRQPVIAAIELKQSADDSETPPENPFTPTNEITLQVPDVNVDSISATGTVVSGETLLLIPSSSPQPTKPARGVPMTGLKKAFGAEPQEIPTRMAILITMRKTEPVSQPSPPQPEPELLSDEQVLSFYLRSGR